MKNPIIKEKDIIESKKIEKYLFSFIDGYFWIDSIG